jgi:hypothetical protein
LFGGAPERLGRIAVFFGEPPILLGALAVVFGLLPRALGRLAMLLRRDGFVTHCSHLLLDRLSDRRLPGRHGHHDPDADGHLHADDDSGRGHTGEDVDLPRREAEREDKDEISRHKNRRNGSHGWAISDSRQHSDRATPALFASAHLRYHQPNGSESASAQGSLSVQERLP